MNFSVIEVVTKNGETYRIPSMPEATIQDFISDLEKHGGGKLAELTLVTQDQVVLVIPWRIIGVLRINGEDRWRSLV